MKILFVTSECAPFSKSGGLADVAFSLPPALKKTGDEIAIITPLYQCVREKYGEQLSFVIERNIRLGRREIYCGLWRGELSGVTVWFLDNREFFDRPKLYGYSDDSLRFAYFSRAVVDLLDELDFFPQILHCNDWETAPVILYLKNDIYTRPELRGVKTVYTIHNIAYQGQFGSNELYDTFALPWGWYDGGLGYEFEGRRDINLMKGAMLMADAVSTVSPTYARELHYPYYAHGLQGVVDLVDSKLYGILNGIDTEHYNPEIDPVIPHHFSIDDMSGKQECKRDIQRVFGLDTDFDAPLLCSVARLNEQKGIELIRQIMPDLMNLGVQLIVFGQGEQKYIDYFEWAKRNWPGQIGFSSDYNEPMASRIFAGCDMYLMPSRFEPCGLSQMMAMRYGTVPIVHETGGLKDSVRAYKEFDGIGDGFSFSDYQAKDLYLAIFEAVRLFFGDEERFGKLRRRCMTKDFTWDKSAGQYNSMYADICGQELGADGPDISYEEAFGTLRDAYLAIDKKNREKYADAVRKDFHFVMQIEIMGKGAGFMRIEFKDGEIRIDPTFELSANAYIEAGYETLMAIARGEVTVDKMFLGGQLKINGNLTNGFQLRKLLSPTKD